MDAVKFIKEWKRMCKKQPSCGKCPIGCINDVECALIVMEHSEQIAKIVEKWSAEHPEKTRQDEFLKLFPNVKLFNGRINICPKDIDTKDENLHSINCNIVFCDECKRKYWLEEME